MAMHERELSALAGHDPPVGNGVGFQLAPHAEARAANAVAVAGWQAEMVRCGIPVARFEFEVGERQQFYKQCCAVAGQRQ
jgi:hypothetical protein